MKDKVSVLVAEDGEIYRRVVRDGLEREHFDVLEVDEWNGILERGPEADVLVVDVRFLSGIHAGIEAVASLIAAGRLAAKVPVIFISQTGETDERNVHKLASLPHLKGRYVWLQKPFEVDMLVEIIHRQLDMRHA